MTGAAPLALHGATPAELKARADAQREGLPHLIYRDAEGTQVILPLDPRAGALTVGRRTDCDLPLPWEAGVSRLHAQLEPVGGVWTLIDDGLSQNGSWIDGVRLTGRRRLRDGDVLRFGRTQVAFCAPSLSQDAATVAGSDVGSIGRVPPAQRRVLVELCRPLFAEPPGRLPATNRDIAEALFLSLDAVKTHLRQLSRTFDVESLPQNQKRVALAERAVRIGAVTARDFAA